MTVFNVSANRAGIQGHSQGEVFPITEPIVERDGCRAYESWAPFAPNCKLSASDYEGQRANSEFLLRLEKIADAACAGLAGGGFSVDFDGNPPSSGYMASEAGNERRVSPDSPYGNVYKYLFDHADHLLSGGYVGGWVYDGQLYLDCSYNFAQKSLALDYARDNNQLAIWDVADCKEIAVCPE